MEPHPRQHKPSSVHSGECNPMTGLVHHKARRGAQRTGRFGSRGRAALTATKAEGLSSKQSGEDPGTSQWVCFERGWCQGRAWPDHHRPHQCHTNSSNNNQTNKQTIYTTCTYYNEETYERWQCFACMCMWWVAEWNLWMKIFHNKVAQKSFSRVCCKKKPRGQTIQHITERGNKIK